MGGYYLRLAFCDNYLYESTEEELKWCPRLCVNTSHGGGGDIYIYFWTLVHLYVYFTTE